MEIAEIKERLTINQVLQHYGLQPNKNGMLNCPFHEDKTPSLQVYSKTNTVYCFSSNCSTHGKSLDVIDFILHKEASTSSAFTKHEAIEKAKNLLGYVKRHNTEKVEDQTEKIKLLERIYSYFCNAVQNSQPAKQYLKERGLEQLIGSPASGVGYNSGQFHHGERKDKTLIDSCLKYGLLLDKGHINNKTGEKAFSPFGKNSIVFPLKNQQDQIVSLYFRSIIDNKESRHFYLRDRQGLYPKYPDPNTQILILTESIIDAATLIQSEVLTLGSSILTLFGTNGLTTEHSQAISQLKQLREIVLWFDGDAAGRKAVEKHTATLRELAPQATVTKVEMPEGEDINSLVQGHPSGDGQVKPGILEHLFNQRTSFVYSTENHQQPSKSHHQVIQQKTDKHQLNTADPQNLIYQTNTAEYQIKGFNAKQTDSLKVTLRVIKERHLTLKLDLYDYLQIEKTSKAIAEKLNLDKTALETDLEALMQELETYKESQSGKDKEEKKQVVQVSEASQRQCIELLKSHNLMEKLNDLIGQSGVIGEYNNRLFLFGIATSYKMPNTLHALIQGSSGSGKTHLLTRISNLIPSEDKKHFTRVTDSSLYNYGRNELSNKLLCLEDLDGMREEAYLAFRELQSRGMISSSTSIKDEQGNIKAVEKTVCGPIASMSCTTKGEIYEDNMNRCFLIAVDESAEQTQRVIHYQNQLASGSVDKAKQHKAAELLTNCIRLLQSHEVVNPYAGKVSLPPEAQKIRRLNELYQSYVKQITLINQYRRETDKQGRLISSKEDLQTAAEIMFESILLKVDELDGSLRDFYESLKDYVESKGGDSYSFSQREIRQTLKVSKTQLHRFMHDLIELEYIRQIGGHANRGYEYKITYWDNVQALRSKVKRHLQGQLDQLELVTV